MAESHQQQVTLEGLDRFPPTVVGHTDYGDGVDLELLDSGTEEQPRLIRVFDNQESEVYL